MKRLYKFEFDFGRGYEGNGIFWSTPEQIKKVLGKTVDFGEICGKHSEVSFDLKESMFTDITDKIEELKVGLQPLEYFPMFDLIELPDSTLLSHEDLEEYNDKYELIELRSDLKYEDYWRQFRYGDSIYEVIDSKEKEGLLVFLAKEIEDA